MSWQECGLKCGNAGVGKSKWADNKPVYPLRAEIFAEPCSAEILLPAMHAADCVCMWKCAQCVTWLDPLWLRRGRSAGRSVGAREPRHTYTALKDRSVKFTTQIYFCKHLGKLSRWTCTCVWSSVYVIYLHWCIILQGFYWGTSVAGHVF